MSLTRLLLALLLLFGVSLLDVAGRSYNNGLIFYDLVTRMPYLPPTVSVSRGRTLTSVKYSEKGSIWSTFGQPCECSGAVCGCCAGLQVKQFNFDQKLCANVTYEARSEEAQLEVHMNERPSAKYGISVRNPSPFCIPVMMGVPMAMCVQMSNIAVQGNNLNMCMDFVVRLATTDLFEMHFQCMKMGLDGVMYVDANGAPVIPPSNAKVEDGVPTETAADEMEEEELQEEQEQLEEEPQQEEDQQEEVEADYYDEATTPADSENEIASSDEQQHVPQSVGGGGGGGYAGTEQQQQQAGNVNEQWAGEIVAHDMPAEASNDFYAPDGAQVADVASAVAVEEQQQQAALPQSPHQSNEPTSAVEEEEEEEEAEEVAEAAEEASVDQAEEPLATAASEIAISGNEVEAADADVQKEQTVAAELPQVEDAVVATTAASDPVEMATNEITTIEAYNEADITDDGGDNRTATVATSTAATATETTPATAAAETTTSAVDGDMEDEEYEAMTEDGTDSDMAEEEEEQLETAAGEEMQPTEAAQQAEVVVEEESTVAAATESPSAATEATASQDYATAAAMLMEQQSSMPYVEAALEAEEQEEQANSDSGSGSGAVDAADSDESSSVAYGDTLNEPAPTTTMLVEQLTMELPHAGAASDDATYALLGLSTTPAPEFDSSAEASEDLLAAPTAATVAAINEAPPATEATAPVVGSHHVEALKVQMQAEQVLPRRRSTLPHVHRRRLYG